MLVVAFEGWSDAAEVSSTVARIICDSTGAEILAAIDPEDYYDFQYSRPQVSFDDEGARVISWPTTEFCVPSDDAIERDKRLEKLHIVLGAEPSRRWRSFISELMEIIVDREIESVLFLGSMLADAPHTRPIAVTGSTLNERVRLEKSVEKTSYEGPVGILGVLGVALEAAGIPALALWAAVPHYVHSAPSPKAVLALLTEVERHLGLEFDHGTLSTEAFAWERGIDELAASDEEMAGYITQLESTRDALESATGSGETIASELEQFLRQEERGGDSPKGETGSSD